MRTFRLFVTPEFEVKVESLYLATPSWGGFPFAKHSCFSVGICCIVVFLAFFRLFRCCFGGFAGRIDVKINYSSENTIKHVVVPVLL